MLTLKETREQFRTLAENAGRSNLLFVVKEWTRERVNPDREKRIKFPKSEYQRLFDKQHGFRKWCNDHLEVPAVKNHIDHIDPHAEDWNGKANRQLLHVKCNLEKSSMSLLEQSKVKGRTMLELTEEEA